MEQDQPAQTLSALGSGLRPPSFNSLSAEGHTLAISLKETLIRSSRCLQIVVLFSVSSCLRASRTLGDTLQTTGTSCGAADVADTGVGSDWVKFGTETH